jgi:hypothetical protein
MRQPPEHFGEQDLDLVYIAKKLVEPDRYKGGLIFQSERIGAFFYVLPEVVESARTSLKGAGYKPYDPTNP